LTGFSLFSSFPSDKCRDGTSNVATTLPSICFPIHCSVIIIGLYADSVVK
jgi:hypothetical protein